jgi:hypothetical protein
MKILILNNFQRYNIFFKFAIQPVKRYKNQIGLSNSGSIFSFFTKYIIILNFLKNLLLYYRLLIMFKLFE